MSKHLENLNRLWTLSYRFRVQFSHVQAEPIEVFRTAISEVLGSSFVLSSGDPEFGRADGEPRRNARERHEAVVFESRHGEQLDSIAAKVQAASTQISETCRDTLESDRTLFKWINFSIGRK